MRRSIGIALTLCWTLPAVVACGGPARDLDVVCEEATKAVARTDVPADMRVVVWQRQCVERVSRGSPVGNTLRLLAGIDPSRKAQEFYRTAADLGRPDWRCPAIEELWPPGPRPTGGTPAQAVPLGVDAGAR
jgi:hypothetical protein